MAIIAELNSGSSYKYLFDTSVPNYQRYSTEYKQYSIVPLGFDVTEVTLHVQLSNINIANTIRLGVASIESVGSFSQLSVELIDVGTDKLLRIYDGGSMIVDEQVAYTYSTEHSFSVVIQPSSISVLINGGVVKNTTISATPANKHVVFSGDSNYDFSNLYADDMVVPPVLPIDFWENLVEANQT